MNCYSRPDGVVGYHVSLTPELKTVFGQGPGIEPQSGHLFASILIIYHCPMLDDRKGRVKAEMFYVDVYRSLIRDGRQTLCFVFLLPSSSMEPSKLNRSRVCLCSNGVFNHQLSIHIHNVCDLNHEKVFMF